MIPAGAEKRNCLEIILKRVLRWLEGPCHWINKTAARWWAETLWFFSCALVVLMAGSYFHTGQVFGAKWWEALTAFGTLAAVLVALFLAAKSEKDRRASNELQASIYAVYLTKRLEPVIGPLKAACTGPLFDSLDGSDNKYQRFVEEFSEVKVDVDLEDVAKLADMGNLAAQRIAAAIADIECLNLKIREYERLDQLSSADKRLPDEWLDIANRASDCLSAAVNSLVYANLRYASPPTGEEIYGNPEDYGSIKKC
ncbi:hypothetical protein NBV64_08940 [Alcaligenes sp. DN25]|uniref:hypothetical protein n=1 Tax=Alcaligenes TaxID=507 RepID=UPI002030588C|nr:MULTISPECIES: hypothetical protein [Alcaligenes]URW84453.1 hypothetical protein NBV64_08940 [Alcaligenes sp. DN25]WEA69293.1 hypothetical protein PWH35_08965 [Alcaligenes faecalis]